MKQEYFEVEFDLEYTGGDYSGVGDTVLIPVCNEDDIEESFEKQTGHSRIHVIYYTLDEVYDEDGELIEYPNWN